MNDKEKVYKKVFFFVLAACETNELHDQSSPSLLRSVSLEETK